MFTPAGKYALFETLLNEQYEVLEESLSWADERGKSTCLAWKIESRDDLRKKLDDFQKQIAQCVTLANEKDITNAEENPMFHGLRHAFVDRGLRGLSDQLKYLFISFALGPKITHANLEGQERFADMRYPLEWYPATRAMQRTIHLHVGPTNSGKTYHALQKLEAAGSGIYAGPLRLLAHEVYTRFNAKGKTCALITGEERRIPENLTQMMSACTVEMVPLNTKVDVAVIDEIQMMGDSERGWAWTQAFLGVQAREVHLCGELRTVDLITELCKAIGDKLVIHRYDRLSPLMMSKGSLKGNYNRLQKGDAMILFSRVGIHAVKRRIEKVTGRRCAVVYGSLPPETRAQQASLFNEPDNDYDFLVASDAVGMGLNLSIRRIIFDATSKHDGTGYRIISTSEIKQIAGRAGRYKTAHEAIKSGPYDLTGGEPTDLQSSFDSERDRSIGYVTTLERFDFPVIDEAMKREAEPLKAAGIFPPASIIQRFASYFPAGTPFSYILLRLHNLARINPRFFVCDLKEQTRVADMIQSYKLTVEDRLVFMAAPVSLREAGFTAVLQELAQCVAEQSSGHLLDIKSLDLELLNYAITDVPGGSVSYLQRAETLHKAITLYLWLSYRFSGVFRSQALAFHAKELVEKKIDECLDEVIYDEKKSRKVKYLRQRFITNEKGYRFRRPLVNDVADQPAYNNIVDNPNGSGDPVTTRDEAHDSEDSPSSDAGIPSLPAEDIPNVVNRGPLWEKIEQQDSAHP